MDVDAILRHNTDRLLKILRRELNAERKKLLEDIHRRTLVRIFVENRIYKDIEECKTADAVHKAVRDGLSPFRDELPRDITRQDIEMLLGIPIRRISRFDIEKSRREVEKLRKEIERIEKNLGNLTAYTIRYLQNLLKKYGDAYPRRTQLQTFREVAIRRLTASELCMRLDTEKGYIGTEIEGEALFECSSLDRVMMVWKDGRYKMMPPPGKHFVGEDFLYAAVYDRNRIMTMVYKDEAITYIKRFKFGGAIMNRDYRCTPEHAEVLFFADNDPDTLYVKYRKAKRQRINQQVFHPRKQSAKNVKAKGAQMTVKKIRSIQTHKPRNWDRQENPSGALIDFT
jgi:topoisomerase-4 subunit A